VNLRRARKAKARDEKEKTAEANRAKFGTAKRERENLKADREQSRHVIDQHKLDEK